MRLRSRIYKNNTPILITYVVTLLAFLGILFIGALLYTLGDDVRSSTLKNILLVTATVPPIWFWIEYFVLFRKWGLVDSIEHFKYAQQLSAAVWAGVLVMLFSFAGVK